MKTTVSDVLGAMVKAHACDGFEVLVHHAPTDQKSPEDVGLLPLVWRVKRACERGFLAEGSSLEEAVSKASEAWADRLDDVADFDRDDEEGDGDEDWQNMCRNHAKCLRELAAKLRGTP